MKIVESLKEGEVRGEEDLESLKEGKMEDKGWSESVVKVEVVEGWSESLIEVDVVEGKSQKGFVLFVTDQFPHFLVGD